MRNYIKFFRCIETFQSQQPPGSGNWVTTSTFPQFGADEDELQERVNVDAQFVQAPDFRMQVSEFEKAYLLLDKRFIIDSLTEATIYNETRTRTDSPKKWWSDGR